MKTRRMVVLAIVVILGSAGAAEAQDKDFTIHVPVEVQSLVPDANPFIDCMVKAGSSGALIGRERIYFTPDADGNFSGTVVVSFDAASGGMFGGVGQDPALATYYHCGVRNDFDTSGACTIGANENDSRDECRADQNEPVVNYVSGSIP